MSIAVSLHLLFVVVWVGGMFFAYMALRPAAAATLDPPLRLPLWVATFKRFFVWVWLSIIFILATGFWMIAQMGGLDAVGLYVKLMTGVGILMILIFLHLFFAPYRRLRHAVAAADWPSAGKCLNQIRVLVATNLTLGLITIIVAKALKPIA